MSVRFDATADSLTSSAGVIPSLGSGFGIGAFVRIVTDQNANTWLFGLGGSSSAEYFGAVTDTDGTSVLIFTNGASGLGLSSSISLTVGQWYFIGLSHDGATTGTITVVDAVTQSIVASQTLTTAMQPSLDSVQFAADYFQGWPFNGRLQAPRVYSNYGPTSAEWLAEAAALTPVRTTDLWANWSFATNSAGDRTTDLSGNSRTLTNPGGAGVWQTEADPPLAVASPAGLAVAVSFGTPTLTPGSVTVTPSGLAVPVRFGQIAPVGKYLRAPNQQPSRRLRLFVSGTYAPVQQSGAAQAVLEDRLYDLTGTTGAQNATPAGLAVPVSLTAPTVTPGSVTVNPAGIAVPVGLTPPALTPVLNPSGLAVAVGLTSPTVTPGAVTAQPAGLAVAVGLTSPTVTPGSVTVQPSGLAVAVGLTSPTVTSTATVQPAGLAVPWSFGTPVVTLGGSQVASPSGLAVAVGLTSPTLTPGSVTVNPGGLAVAVGLTSPTRTNTNTAQPSGLAVPVSFTSPTVTPGSVTVNPAGLAVAVGLGAATRTAGTISVNPSGLPVLVGLGSTSATPAAISRTPSGIAVPVFIGQAQTLTQLQTVNPAGIAVPFSLGRVNRASLRRNPTVSVQLAVSGQTSAVITGDGDTGSTNSASVIGSGTNKADVGYG